MDVTDVIIGMDGMDGTIGEAVIIGMASTIGEAVTIGTDVIDVEETAIVVLITSMVGFCFKNY